MFGSFSTVLYSLTSRLLVNKSWLDARNSWDERRDKKITRFQAKYIKAANLTQWENND